MDFLREFGGVIATVAIASMTFVSGWVKSISVRQNKADTRLAILENNNAQIPGLLKDIKDEIHGMRQDGRERERGLYDRMDKLRLEFKTDLDRKQDR